MPESYSQFFLRVTGNGILPYQERYGLNPFLSTLMVIPTGLGKTDAVLMPWLHAQSEMRANTPTRLIVVLPRQNLTEQTASVARKRVETAQLQDRVCVLELMGGSRHNQETLGPEQPAIIVCTQDMYLSRALNRGYARRQPRWPIDFALFNNDCLIVLDEVQLMSDGLATSTQLAAFRQTFGVFGNVPCVWMSATVDPAWLDTVDFRKIRPELRVVELEDDDKIHEVVKMRVHSPKSIAPAPMDCRTPKGCAEFAVAQHRPAERTLIVINTVARAREIYAEVRKQFAGAVLLHSRFRPADRKRLLTALNAVPEEGQIVVATQVLEAGVDISSNRLITDVAPWGSLVQRFGRANRYGEISNGADIWWVDEPLRAKVKADDAEKIYAPYTLERVKAAKKKLTGLNSAAPADLPGEDDEAPWQHVLRRSDLLDLFDTSSDLSGNEIDVSRFIRSGEERDVFLAWRDWEGETPSKYELDDAELCPAPLGEIREFAKKHKLYRWDFAREEWELVDRDKLYPGMLLLTRTAEGGYSAAEGWNPESKTKVEAVSPDTRAKLEGDTSNTLSFVRFRQLLRDHTDAVVRETRHLLDQLERIGLGEYRAELERAAQLHDWGKAHEVMQKTLRGDEITDDLLGKSAKNEKHSVAHFRHELASALAMLATGESDLAAYVVAAHHGRVRMSIRSMPGERDRVRGIRGGVDTLPACEPASGVAVQEVLLSVDTMRLGQEDGGAMSWTDRVLRLREKVGPFRLAYLEMLLRSADERASAMKQEAAGCGS